MKRVTNSMFSTEKHKIEAKAALVRQTKELEKAVAEEMKQEDKPLEEIEKHVKKRTKKTTKTK